MMDVVIADDESWICALIAGMVSWKRLRLRVAGMAYDGLSCLELCRRKRPDILITDIRMPGMDGLELCRRMAEELPDTELILVTGHDEFEYARRAIALGVSDYIMKPVEAGPLEEALAKAADAADRRRMQRREREELARRIKALQDGSTDREAGIPEDGGDGAEGPPLAELPPAAAEDPRIVRALRFLHGHFGERLNLERVASEAYMDGTYFSETFKAKMGIGYADYLAELRMSKAKELLRNPGLRVKDVAALTGFADPDYFARVFRKRFGFRPRERNREDAR